MTRREIDTYEYIKGYILENGYAPSVREIADGISLKSMSSAHAHIKAIENMGLITTKKGASRAIKLNGYEYIQKEDVFGKYNDVFLNANTLLRFKNAVNYFISNKFKWKNGQAYDYYTARFREHGNCHIIMHGYYNNDTNSLEFCVTTRSKLKENPKYRWMNINVREI